MTKSLQSEADRRIVIGRIGAPHGIHGAVNIQPLTDFATRFEDLRTVYVGDDLLAVAEVRASGHRLLMTFADCHTPEKAAGLTGKLLSVRREDAAPLAEGEYYTFDIIGLQVFDMENNFLGEISNVLKTGSNDVYVIKAANKGQDILLPALKKVVRDINLSEQRMVVQLLKEE